jgi:dipeptidyl aminopeptidase/acylaminoacyl peptidase
MFQYICCCFGLFLMTGSSPAAQDSTSPALTIESIMRNPKWIGTSPYDVRWSEDGRQVYFMWNPENAEEASLYTVSREGRRPRRASMEELRALPPATGDYDRRRTRKVYEREGDIFLLQIESGQIRQLTRTTARESVPRFTSDSQGITFVCDYNLFLMDLSLASITQLTDFRMGDTNASHPSEPSTQEQWLSSQEQRLFETLREKQQSRGKRQHTTQAAARAASPPKIAIDSGTVSQLSLSPDERFVTFRTEHETDSSRQTIIPNYITESGFTTTEESRSKVSGLRIKYDVGIYDIARDTVYYASTSDLPDICRQPQLLSEYFNATDSADAEHIRPCPRPTIIHGPLWSDDGRVAIVEVRTTDFKDRWIARLHVETGTLESLDYQHDEAWIGGPGIYGLYAPGSLGWFPDNRRIWFQSEATGYSHLYTLDVTTGEKTQLTQGAFEVSEASLSRNGKYFYFVSNDIHPGETNCYRLNSDGGQPERISGIPGSVQAVLSPDETKLALLHSTSIAPRELLIQDNRPNATPVQVTQSVSEEYKKYPWRIPKIVTFAARDSATVHARLYLPKEMRPGSPAVMFVHGAGYMQNVCNGGTWYFRDQMFHNFLADHGYLVMDIDYRGSAGYGRDWRTGIYRHMGGKDLSDYVDGVRFLVDKYDVDPEKVGIYGGSYGGFLALMAIFTEPETFAAAAALRAVTDWAHYEDYYTAEILNLPFTDSLAYVRSSPIYFAEGLRGALLICHGMLDDNVHFQDVVRLSQRLIELGKENWELAAYPAEGHTFQHDSSWIDEYKRIFKLFEEHLK